MNGPIRCLRQLLTNHSPIRRLRLLLTNYSPIRRLRRLFTNRGNDEKKECQAVLTRYLSLDKGERVPGALTRHFMSCARCRKCVSSLIMAERISSSPLSVSWPVTESAINEVLRRAQAVKRGAIENAPRKTWPGRMTMPSWIIVGILMLLSMVAFVLGAGGFSVRVDKAVGLVFALVVTLYCVAFVTGNIDYFVKKTGIGLKAA